MRTVDEYCAECLPPLPDNMVAKWRLLKLCLKWFTVNPVPASLWQFEYLPWVFWQPSQYFLSILSSCMGFEGFLWLCIPLKEDKLVYNSGRERSTKSSFPVRLHIFTSPSLFLVFPALSLSRPFLSSQIYFLLSFEVHFSILSILLFAKPSPCHAYNFCPLKWYNGWLCVCLKSRVLQLLSSR